MSPTTWVLLVTLISSVVSAGFATAAFVRKRTDRISEGYALCRSLALVVGVIVAAVLVTLDPSARAGVVVAAAAMIVVQLGDGVVGIQQGIFRTIGPLLTALANLLVLLWFVGA